MQTETVESIDMDITMGPAMSLGKPSSMPLAETRRDDVLLTALNRGFSAEQIHQLMDLRDRQEARDLEIAKREAERAFRADFAAFTAEGIVIPKTKRVEQRARGGGAGPTYMQTEYHVVSGMLKPALGRHGFGVRFDNKFQRGTDGGIAWCVVTCILEHRLGHVETLTLEGPPDDSGSKNPLQEMQSSATFLMRHALLSITATAQAGDDNDGRGARGYAEDSGSDGAAPQVDDSLITTGEEQAAKGMAALTAWWGSLTEAQRKGLTPKFGAMRKTARDADGARK